MLLSLQKLSGSTANVQIPSLADEHTPVVIKELGPVLLEMSGQGTISYQITNTARKRKKNIVKLAKLVVLSDELDDEDRFKISLLDQQKNVLFRIIVTNRNFEMVGNLNFDKSQLSFDFDLINHKASSNIIWISLNKNGTVKLGCGYMMEMNRLVTFTAKNDAVNVIKNVHFVNFDKEKYITETKYWRQPITRDLHPKVTKLNSFIGLDDGNGTPVQDLPFEGRTLYGYVKYIEPSDVISPEDAKAYNYSCDTEGCVLNNKLKEKLKNKYGVNDIKQTYIRVPLGQDRGNAPGTPLVVEIWPRHHYSPIHSHGNANAIIKVLLGEIHCTWYNKLVEKNGNPIKLKEGVLKQGEVTWMSSEMYQTHQLFNHSDSSLAISIQCYKYSANDINHHETFDYITEGDRVLKSFKPGADFEFKTLNGIVRNEYINRPKVTYTIEVKTANEYGAGTDANISIQLFGEYGDSEPLELKKSLKHHNKFEANHTDIFKFPDMPTLGCICRIKIWREDSNALIDRLTGNAWKCEYVSVTENLTGKTRLFPSNKWFSKNIGDKQISREINCVEY